MGVLISIATPIYQGARKEISEFILLQQALKHSYGVNMLD
jgi:hypothetical protein